MIYIIKDDYGYWNNEQGWVGEKGNATIFTKKERTEFHNSLPMGDNVVWLKVY